MEYNFCMNKKDYKLEALKMHENHGKFTMSSKVKVETREDLALAYSPGVAEPCLKIAEDKSLANKYTMKGNTIAVVTDGTAVLGLGDIGPEAGLPVMEGKAILFKQFGDVEAVPLAIATKDPDEIVNFCKLIAPTFGGINLEDISSPNCVYIERRLKEELDIPVFHDDQHGTAIVLTAALINSVRLTGKKLEDLTAILAGTGAAGSSIARMMKNAGVGKILAFNSRGMVSNARKNNFVVQELLDEGIIESWPDDKGTLAEGIKGTDIFVGVSAAGIVSKEMVRSMNPNPWVFAMANPTPEIMPDEAIEAGAAIVGTGRSDFKNQINNLLAFPGIFKGVLSVNGKSITEETKLAAAEAIAHYVTDDKLSADWIVPDSMDKGVASAVAARVAKVTK